MLKRKGALPLLREISQREKRKTDKTEMEIFVLISIVEGRSVFFREFIFEAIIKRCRSTA